jgi:hypothetical protein
MTSYLLHQAAADQEIQRRLRDAEDYRRARLVRGPRRWPTRPKVSR